MNVVAPLAGQTPGATDQATFASGLRQVLRSVWTVLEFEFRKSRTWKRVLVWLAVAFFPAVIISLMLFTGGPLLPRAGWVSAVFVMACEMVVVLNAMLWVAPIVQAELEGKTWLYVAARPYGRVCLVLGKLLNGLVWTLGAGLLALVLVAGVAWFKSLPLQGILGGTPPVAATPAREAELTPEQQAAQRALALLRAQMESDPKLRELVEQTIAREGTEGLLKELNLPRDVLTAPEPEPPPFESAGDVLRVGGILATLAVLAGLTYSSLFCVIGCIIPKRAMLIAFSYTLVFETVVAFVPAIINRLTIQYHLRCLLNRWVDLEVPLQGQELFFSDWPAWWHVSVLVGMIVVWQIVSLTVVHLRQYVLTDEN